MAKAYSGLRSSGVTTDRDYDAKGSGLLGSKTYGDIESWNDYFGVKYKDDFYIYNNYDNTRSEGMFADWYNSVTKDELAAAVRYTGSSYTTINRYLRNDDMSNAPDWVKNTVKNIDSAMKKFELKDAITVWRGGSNKLLGGASSLAQIEALKGAIVQDKGVMSTAVTKEQMWTTSGGNIGYEVVYPRGKGRGIFVDPVSENHGEAEFMAARGTHYEVLGGYRDSNGRLICRLKAVYNKK